MPKLIHKDFAVLSPDDRILHTFGSYDLAEAYFIQRDGWTMGLQLVRLRTTKEVYEVSRPGPSQDFDFTIPDMPQEVRA